MFFARQGRRDKTAVILYDSSFRPFGRGALEISLSKVPYQNAPLTFSSISNQLLRVSVRRRSRMDTSEKPLDRRASLS